MTIARAQRVAEAIKIEVSNIIQRELKDRRVGFVTVIRVEVSADLRYAKIYASVMGEEKEKRDTLNGLRHAAGFIRSLLGKRLNLRYSPELSFILDRSLEHSIRIDKLLEKINRSREAQEDETKNEDAH